MSDLVYCHECQHEWQRGEHGLTCPLCRSEFTEVAREHPIDGLDILLTLTQVEPEHDPRHEQMDFDAIISRSPSPGLAQNLQEHNPWDEEHAPDPDDGDIEEHITQTFGPGGSVHYTRTTFRSTATPFGTVSGRGHVATFGNANANAHPIFGQLGRLMEDLSGQGQRPSATRSRSVTRNRRESETRPGMQRNRSGSVANDLPPRMGGRFSYTSTATLSPRDANQAQLHIEPVDSISSLLEQLLRGMPGPNGPASTGGPMGFASILAAALNPANAASGDAVYTQEALDRVISGLMEQNQGSNATAPASEAAIKSLPKRKLVPQDLGDNGLAECNICMDNVGPGDEVTVLPCAHWYHEACVAAWLKESDTCPVCRKGIMPKEGEHQARSSHQDPRNPEPWRGGNSNPWSSITGSANQAGAAGDRGTSSPEGSGTSSGSNRRRSRHHSSSSHGSRSSSYRLAGNTRPTEGQSRRSSRSHGSQGSTSGGGFSSRVRNMFSSGGNGASAQ